MKLTRSFPSEDPSKEAWDLARFERERLVGGANLPPEDFEDFQRLCKSIRYTGGFRLLVAVYGDSTLRDQVIDRLDAVLAAGALTSRIVVLGAEGSRDVADLVDCLAEGSQTSEVVHVVESDDIQWHQRSTWEALNTRREGLAQRVRSALLFWLRADAVAEMARHARDLWAWRGGMYEFIRAPERRLTSLDADPRIFDPRPLADKARRIAELRDIVVKKADIDDALLAPLAFELGDLCESIGEPERALAAYRDYASPAYERLGDVRSKAVTMGRIADVLQAKGQLDEALGIRREEQLPIYERLGSARDLVVCRSEIAGTLLSEAMPRTQRRRFGS